MKLILFTLLFTLQLFGSDTQTEKMGQPPYSYPLAGCLTCGDALGDQTATLFHADRELKFCCIECVGSYTNSPETYISNLEEQIRSSQRENYPLNICIISEHELGSMGDPIEYVSGNTLVKFCCGACIEKFEQNREQMLYKLREAAEAKQGE